MFSTSLSYFSCKLIRSILKSSNVKSVRDTFPFTSSKSITSSCSCLSCFLLYSKSFIFCGFPFITSSSPVAEISSIVIFCFTLPSRWMYSSSSILGQKFTNFMQVFFEPRRSIRPNRCTILTGFQ